jgi:hypothetical protein
MSCAQLQHISARRASFLGRPLHERELRCFRSDGPAVVEKGDGNELVTEKSAFHPHERQHTRNGAVAAQGGARNPFMSERVLHDAAPLGKVAKGGVGRRLNERIPARVVIEWRNHKIAGR